MNQAKICRFCLEAFVENDVEVIEELKKEMLEMLLIKMNFNVTKEPTICKNCMDKLETSFSFKSTCLYTEDLIVPYVINSVKLDLKEVYLKECVDKQINISACENICRLCLKVYNKECFHTLQSVKDQQCLNNILEKYLPELNLDATNEVLICEACFHFLQYYYNFVFMCLDTETKIKLYCQHEKLNSSQQVSLERLIELPIKESNIKECISSDEYTENTNISTSNYVLENIIKLENIEIEIKDENQFEHEDDSTSQYDNEVMENEISQKSSKPNHSDNHLTKSTWNHLHPSEETTYTCFICSFTTNHKKTLDTHMILHKSGSEDKAFFCQHCSFKTMQKSLLNKHLVCHKDSSEVGNKCELCNFCSTSGISLKEHMASHTQLEADVMKCDLCDYKTVHHDDLKLHMLVHSKSEMYNCDKCSFKTKYSSSLKNHMFIHKSASELQLYKCNFCNYITVKKNTLKRHAVIHESSVTKFKCDQCEFETKRARIIREHKKRHEHPSSFEMYKCKNCTFQTKTNALLQRHVLSKHSIAETTDFFHCYNCPYKSIRKDSLRSHVLTHMDKKRLTTFKCEFCPYEAKYKRALRKHMEIHEDDSIKKSVKKNKFKCSSCIYEAKHECELTRHKLVHHNTSDVVHKCNICSYTTKILAYLKLHAKKHKDKGW